MNFGPVNWVAIAFAERSTSEEGGGNHFNVAKYYIWSVYNKTKKGVFNQPFAVAFAIVHICGDV